MSHQTSSNLVYQKRSGLLGVGIGKAFKLIHRIDGCRLFFRPFWHQQMIREARIFQEVLICSWKGRKLTSIPLDRVIFRDHLEGKRKDIFFGLVLQEQTSDFRCSWRAPKLTKHSPKDETTNQSRPPKDAKWTWKKSLAASATSRAWVTIAAFTASVISSRTLSQVDEHWRWMKVTDYYRQLERPFLRPKRPLLNFFQHLAKQRGIPRIA